MSEAISARNQHSQSGSNFLHGNIAVIAVSSAVRGFGGGFLFQAVDPVLPFYLFIFAEVMAAFFLIRFVREPEKKEF